MNHSPFRFVQDPEDKTVLFTLRPPGEQGIVFRHGGMEWAMAELAYARGVEAVQAHACA